MKTAQARKAASPKKAPPTPAATGPLRRQCTCGTCGECERKKRKQSGDALEIPSSVHDVLRSPGQPLDPNTRAFLEPRFGHDFSRVRVHADPDAARSASAVDARAWTFGNHIAFGSGMYSPSTPRGAGLLAHELTHVVQQQGVSAASQPAIGRAGDRFEREADSHASLLARDLPVPRAAQVSSPVLQRSLLSAFLDVVLFIPRLFGLETFPAEQLREYLQDIRQRRGPARTLFSDNKARACVSREGELGPYDAQTKIWLIQDMLDGWTSFLDEGAIINLLRRSQAQRQQIVTGVGRDLLWSKFSGRNRRIVEALTLGAADAGDALVSRLRNLSPDELQDYSSNTADPAVQDAVRRARALIDITAPVPVAASISQAGVADITINGIQITARPDTINPSLGQHAFTHSDFGFSTYDPIVITPGNRQPDRDAAHASDHARHLDRVSVGGVKVPSVRLWGGIDAARARTRPWPGLVRFRSQQSSTHTPGPSWHVGHRIQLRRCTVQHGHPRL